MSLTNEEYHKIDKKNYLPTFKRFPLAFEKGEGSRLWDVEGKEYIDMLAGVAVNNVGHCHPKVVEALQKQAASLIHISNFFVSPAQVALSEKLTGLSGMDSIFFTNSGAESVEGAVKIARKYAHKNGRGGVVISMEHSFHGRTLATIAMGKKQHQKGFAPIPEGFLQVPFNDIDALKDKLDQEVAAVIVEPVQGEGGIHLANKQYLQELRQVCDQNGILLIFDEIQCGMGRTGKWFAKDHYGVQPDIMTLAKGMGGGMPIGAFLCKAKISAVMEYGDHGTTFGGNPLACAAGLATLEVINTEKLCDQAMEKGEWLLGQLKDMKNRHQMIKGVRGLGLMIGVELDGPAPPLVKKLLDKGVIANATAGNILRFVPPLNIEKEYLQKVLSLTEECLNELEAENAE